MNKQKSAKSCDHKQLSGMSIYDEDKYFTFHPDDNVRGQVKSFRALGIAQQLDDGTFDFVRKPQRKPQSILIKKLDHGRVSETKDGAVLLTIKVFHDEKIDVGTTFNKEADEAIGAIYHYLALRKTKTKRRTRPAQPGLRV